MTQHQNLRQLILSTWREKRIELQPGVNTIDFPDTKPNHIHINNLGNSVLSFGAQNMIPNYDLYDKRIGPGGETLYARELGLERCMIYVDGNSPCLIILTTFEYEFNPLGLATNSGGGGSGGGSSAFDGIIRGFTAPLPAGNNNLGRVQVTDLPPLPTGTNKIGTVDLEELPEGNNLIGRVGVESLPDVQLKPLPQGSNVIGKVEVVGGIGAALPPGTNTIGKVEVSALPDVKLRTQAKVYAVNNLAVTTTNTTLTLPFTTHCINFITNDGDNPIMINMGSSIQYNDALLLYPGECVNDINVQTNTMSIHSVNGSSIVRIFAGGY